MGWKRLTMKNVGRTKDTPYTITFSKDYHPSGTHRILLGLEQQNAFTIGWSYRWSQQINWIMRLCQEMINDRMNVMCILKIKLLAMNEPTTTWYSRLYATNLANRCMNWYGLTPCVNNRCSLPKITRSKNHCRRRTNFGKSVVDMFLFYINHLLL